MCSYVYDSALQQQQNYVAFSFLFLFKLQKALKYYFMFHMKLDFYRTFVVAVASLNREKF